MKLLTITLITVVSAATALAQGAHFEREIRDIIAGSDRAKLNADVAFFERTYADEYSYTSATGSVDNKTTSLEWYRKNLKDSPSFKLTSMESNVESVRVVGDMAVASGTWAATIEGTEKNPHPPYVNRGRFTTVLERRNGRWLVTAEHDSEAPRDRESMLEQVSRLNKEYSFMIQRGDAAEIERVLADDYLLTDEEGKVYTKAEDLATYKTRQSTVKIESVKYLDQKVRAVGDSVVIANATINFKGTKNGKPFDITEQCTTVWAWRKGSWRIVSDHFSYVEK